jgi:hypothetical protein
MEDTTRNAGFYFSSEIEALGAERVDDAACGVASR